MGASLLNLLVVAVDSFFGFDWICSYSQNAIIFSKRVRTAFELNVSGIKWGETYAKSTSI